MSDISFKKIALNDEEDFDRIYNILKICGENMYMNYGLAHWLEPYSINAIRNDAAGKDVYIAYMDGAEIGTFMISERESAYFKNDVPAIYISKFAILPKGEGKGIGSKCMSFIEDQMLLKNIHCIRLEVYTRSDRAVSFYRNKGFLIVDEKPTRRFSVYCMEKRF